MIRSRDVASFAASRGAVMAACVVLGACIASPRPMPPAAARPQANEPPKEKASERRPPRTLPVPAERRPVTHTYGTATVTDDYEWMEDAQSGEVRAFVDAQNALARAKLDTSPLRTAVQERVTAILEATSSDWTRLAHEGGRIFALEAAPPKQQRILVTFAKEPFGSEAPRSRVVVDPNALDPTGRTTIDFYVPSPDGRTVAVSLSKDGTESGDLHLFDVTTGKDRNETIARVNGGTAGGSVAWNADGTGFHYTRYPRAGERPAEELELFQQVWFHRLGAPESTDAVALGKELPSIAEVRLVRSDDGRRILAEVANGDGGEVEHHVFDGGKWIRLSRFADELKTATFGPEGRVYAVARKGAPRGKVITFAPPYDRPAVDVVPEGESVLEDVLVTKTSLYTIEIVDGPSRVRRFPLVTKAEPLAREPRAAKPAKKGAPPPPPTTIQPGARGVASAVLPLPALSSVTGAIRLGPGDDLLLRVESYLDPARWLVYRASEHRVVPSALARKAPWDTSDLEVVRESCVSKDGTRVPMTVLRKRGATLDGGLPAYLTGYGGYGISLKHRMRPAFRVWLDSGGVVAEANLRGGGERGEAWHRAGSLTNKQNVFDDFAACAKALVDLRYTKPERLAIVGASNGGLLVGATLVQHPEMFRVAAADVGLYDMLRAELSPNGAFMKMEYGSVKDEAQFRALRAYSPYHNVKDDTAYPSVLFTTGANDPRVDPYHSRKMVARLQAATGSDRPILLRASSDVGHGQGTPLSAEIEKTTDVLSFLLSEVGAQLPPRARSHDP